MQHSAVQSSTVEYTYSALQRMGALHLERMGALHVWVHYTHSVWVHPPSNPGVKLWCLFGKPPGTTLGISSEKLTVHYSFSNVKIGMDKIVNMLP